MSSLFLKQSKLASSDGARAGTASGRLARAIRVRGFARREDGSVMMSFGLMALVMAIMVGAAVDLGRWLNARDHTIAAIDAAVLAAGRALQTGSTEQQAIALATKYYRQNTKGRIKVDAANDTVNFTVSADKTIVSATGSVRIRTPFLGLADLGATTLDYLPLFAEGEAPKATTKNDEYINTNREVALMLDVSGSMCTPCTKRDDMKLAAADLINILIKDTATTYWTKVALVPFSGDVRPPASVFSQVIGNNPTTKSIASNINGANYARGRDDDDDDDDDDNNNATYLRSACVAERSGAEKYSDAAATTSPNYIMPHYFQSTSTWTAQRASDNCSTPVSGAVVPLTSSKSTLLTAINGLTTGGGTAGHIGTAWSYYMLTPNWAPVLPEGSKPQAYGTEKLQKTAILMTDGEFNYTFDTQGRQVGSSGAGSSANGSTSAAQAVAICEQMKADGIEIFTVGFDLGGNQTAINTLNSCATDPDKAYLASNGESLKQVFRDIAVKLTELHLLR